MNIAPVIPLAHTWAMHGDLGAGWWIVMVALMAVFWGAVILIGALLRGHSDRWHQPRKDRHTSTETPLEILDRRLAEGA